MTGTRPVKKGSFGGDFDELVKLFPNEPLPTPDDADRPARRKGKPNVHDRLFARAWRGRTSPG